MSGFQYDGVDMANLVSPGNSSVAAYYNTLPNINANAVTTSVYINTVSKYGYYIKTSPTATQQDLTEYYIPYTAEFTTGAGGTWYYGAPANFKHFNAIFIGGGGGGGASGSSYNPSNSGAGGGGGGGGMYLFYQSLEIKNYMINGALTFTVGGAGIGGSGPGVNATNGGDTTFYTPFGNLTAYGGIAGSLGDDNSSGNDNSPNAPGGPGGNGGSTADGPTDPNGIGNSGYTVPNGTYNTAAPGGNINAAWFANNVLPPLSGYGNGGTGAPSVAGGVSGKAGTPGGQGYVAFYLFRAAP
jgi:hypothetical protein